MLVINLLGEPGVGKSSTSGGVFYELGVNNFRSEIVNEVAKGYAWETPKDPSTGKSLHHPIFGQQIFLLGEQNRWLERVNNQREIAIMECPLIMTAIYQPDNYLEGFTDLVLRQFNQYNNVNILIERNHKFDPEGRVHTEDDSKSVRGKLLTFMNEHNLPFVTVKTSRDINKKIVKYIQRTYFPERVLLSDYDNLDISDIK